MDIFSFVANGAKNILGTIGAKPQVDQSVNYLAVLQAQKDGQAQQALFLKIGLALGAAGVLYWIWKK